MADFMTQYHLDTIAKAQQPRHGGGLGILLLIALGLVVYLLVSCTHIPGIKPWHDEAQVTLAVPPDLAYTRAIAAVAHMHGALTSQDPATHTLGAQLDKVHVVVQVAPDGPGSLVTITGGLPSDFLPLPGVPITKVQEYAAVLRQGGK